MTAQRWRQIEAIFHAAIETDGPSRMDFVRRSCEGDAAMADELERLLLAFEGERAASAGFVQPRSQRGVFGEYQVDRVLGQGGMGTVYLAHRADGHFEQCVALKVVSAHLRSQFFADRFRNERQILAQLDHPNITRLLDGGVCADGDPYLVMEYVEGLPIHRFCDTHKLPVAERIRLLLPVCSAVEYAHRNLIVHRDLKPGNIVVTVGGVPKLLDFGTAKLMLTATADSTLTKFGMMTPRYASPEQIRGDQVTTVCDVYSLGVLLYELLTGAWPFGDPESPVAGMERVVKQTAPTRPSAALTEQAARLRGESKSRLGRLLDGDLRRVLEKAIDADPRGRYGSVEHLAEDLRRYLDGQPVLARRQTLHYRSVRFVQRNRWRIAVGAVVTAGLSFTAFSALQQYGRNQQRMVQARELSEFYLTDVLNEVSKLPGSMKARLLIVDRARRNLDRLMADAPRDSDLRRALAGAYLKLGDVQGKPFTVSLGDSAGALASYRKAEELSATAGSRDIAMLSILVRARRTIAQIETRAGEYPEARATISATLEPARRLATEAPAGFKVDGKPAAVLWPEANFMLGYAMLNDATAARSKPGLEQTLAQFRRTVAMAEKVQAANPGMPDFAGKCSQYMGFALEGLGKITGNPEYFKQSVAAHRRITEGDCRVNEAQLDPAGRRNCADALGELSWALHNAGEGEEATRAAADSLARMEALAREEPDSGEAQQDLTIAWMHLGAAENSAGRFRDAIGHLRTAEARMPPVREIPANDPTGDIELYLNIYREMARSLEAMHDNAGASSVLQQALSAAGRRTTIGAWESVDLQRRLDALRNKPR